MLGSQLEQQLHHVEKQYGFDVFYGDVTSDVEMKNVINDVVSTCGAIHVNVNCAGVAPAARVVSREGVQALDAFEAVIKVNLVGTFNVLRLVVEQMLKQPPVSDDGERGVVINTASVAAYEGQIGQSAYSASKAGVIGLTLTAARDLARHGIRVNTIAPGIFDTPLMKMAPDKVRDPLLESTQFPHRFGIPAEFGSLAAHIVENAYLNGETIRLDSAMRMKPR